MIRMVASGVDYWLFGLRNMYETCALPGLEKSCRSFSQSGSNIADESWLNVCTCDVVRGL